MTTYIPLTSFSLWVYRQLIAQCHEKKKKFVASNVLMMKFPVQDKINIIHLFLFIQQFAIWGRHWIGLLFFFKSQTKLHMYYVSYSGLYDFCLFLFSFSVKTRDSLKQTCDLNKKMITLHTSWSPQKSSYTASQRRYDYC